MEQTFRFLPETELQRAKAMLKLELGILYDQLAVDSAKLADKVVSGDTTFYLNNSGNLDQVFAQIDALTVKDLKRWANKRLWDRILLLLVMDRSRTCWIT